MGWSNGMGFPAEAGIIAESKKPTRCRLIFYCTSYMFNMFQILLCPSSGARFYDVDYHIGRIEICSAYKKYNKIRIKWHLVGFLIHQLSH